MKANDKIQKTGEVKGFFDSYADTFSAIYQPEKKDVISRLLDSTLRRSMFERMEYTAKIIGESDFKSIIDVGCGPGWYDVLLAKTNAVRITGIDIAPNMIELAEKQARENKLKGTCDFICGDILDMQSQKKYDASISIGVFEYFDAIDEILLKLTEITNEMIIFSLPVKYHWLTPQRFVRYKLRRCPLRFYTEQEISATLKRLNIEDFKITSFGRDYITTINLK